MSTIGVLGGGQLGRMLALDARASGHRVIVRTDEESGGPAAQVADGEVCGHYEDTEANEQFVCGLDAITVEFENLPPELLRTLSRSVPVRPAASSVEICQHRKREKRFLEAHGFTHAPFILATSAAELHDAVASFEGRAIAKTAAFGYDGKGQVRFGPSHTTNSTIAWTMLSASEVVVESFVDFMMEISVVGARSSDGQWVPFQPGENVHVNGILDVTVVPARIPPATAAAACRIAGEIASALGHVGVIGVEFFVLDDWSLVVNEMAPRPHNSGHHTIDACITSQFGQQWRCALNLPLGDPSPRFGAAATANLLGELWADGTPQWSVVTDVDRVVLHLYGKAEPRPGRKMGHLTVLGDTPEEVAGRVTSLRNRLRSETHRSF